MGRYTPNAARRLAQASSRWPAYLVAVPEKAWPAASRELAKKHNVAIAAVFRSSSFLVQVFQEQNGIVRLSICRSVLTQDGQWADGITWDQLQELKHQAGYGAYDAVEVYPADNDVVNVANFRHLWVLPGPLAFAWRANEPGATAAALAVVDAADVDAGQGGAG